MGPNHNHHEKKWGKAFLIALVISLFILFSGTITASIFSEQIHQARPPLPQTTWRYAEFIQAVEQGRIQAVALTPDRTQAIFEAPTAAKDTPKTSEKIQAEKIQVNLPVSDPELINKLVQHNVAITILPRVPRTSRSGPLWPMMRLLSWMPLAILSQIFWVWSLVNCATQETSAQKTAWILILLLTNFLGALLYSLRRKSPRP